MGRLGRPLRLIRGADPYYRTKLGWAYLGDSLELLGRVRSDSVNLVITSPPFALRKRKSYGNVRASQYVDWFRPFAEEVARVLTQDGSFVLDIAGSWNRGVPTRSLYHFDLLLDLCQRRPIFHLAQEFYWHNPAKMPAPAEWVTIRRERVKDSVNPLWWLSKSPHPKASNLRVLAPYSRSMLNLFSRGYNEGPRPSGHVVSRKWASNHGGAIPPNVITTANTRSSDPYFRGCRQRGLEVHPARFAEPVPDFFIRFLTEPGDCVLDPFAGSNIVGYVAEQHGRQWTSIEIVEEYVVGSAYRFGEVGEMAYQKFEARHPQAREQ